MSDHRKYRVSGCLATLGVGLVLGCQPSSSSKSSSTLSSPAPSSAPKPKAGPVKVGDNGALRTKEGRPVWATEPQLLEDFLKLRSEGKYDAASELASGKNAFNISECSHGTKVEVLEVTDTLAKVKITSGQSKGKVVWSSKEQIWEN